MRVYYVCNNQECSRLSIHIHTHTHSHFVECMTYLFHPRNHGIIIIIHRGDHHPRDNSLHRLCLSGTRGLFSSLLFYLYHMKTKGRMNLDNKEFLFLAMYAILLFIVGDHVELYTIGLNDTMLIYTQKEYVNRARARMCIMYIPLILVYGI